MADTNNERIAAIAKRFQHRHNRHPTSGEKERPKRVRVHNSIYLDQALLDQLGEAYRTTSHELYPQELLKSTFLEACIGYALDHLPDIKTILRDM